MTKMGEKGKLKEESENIIEERDQKREISDVFLIQAFLHLQSVSGNCQLGTFHRQSCLLQGKHKSLV